MAPKNTYYKKKSGYNPIFGKIINGHWNIMANFVKSTLTCG